jgi:hypothetical protein
MNSTPSRHDFRKTWNSTSLSVLPPECRFGPDEVEIQKKPADTDYRREEGHLNKEDQREDKEDRQKTKILRRRS